MANEEWQGGSAREAERAAADDGKWCFTFGCGSPLARYYVEIDAESEAQARARMVGLFSQHWSSVYPRDGFDRQITEYSLIRLEFSKSSSVRLMTNHDEMPLPLHQLAYPWD